MRILLLSPPFLADYMRNGRCDFVSLSATQWYPILLGYGGAYLEGKGHEVIFIDAPAQHLNHSSTRNIIIEQNPDLIVLFSGRLSELNDLEFADEIIEQLGCDAVIVGPYASINPEKTLRCSKTINKLVVSEFEVALGDLADGKSCQDISNLVYKKGNEIVSNPIRPYLTTEELDAIPFVSRFFKNHVNLYNYRTPSELYPFVDIMTGRGCKWGLCTYCLWVHTYIKGQTYNVRSIENVIEELRFIESDMPEVRSLMVQDDTFTDDRANAFSEAKIQAGIKLPWSCYARGNLSYDAMRLMKRAGCRNLHVGYESAEQDVLRRIKKGLSVERMTKFTQEAKRAKLRIHGDFAIGFPGETVQGAQKTIKWACDLNPHTAQFQLMIPFPGTTYYDEMKEAGWLGKNGEPDMPQFSNLKIRKTAKQAYRAFYFRPTYLWQCICHPYERVFSRLKTITKAIPAMFWQHWKTQ